MTNEKGQSNTDSESEGEKKERDRKWERERKREDRKWEAPREIKIGSNKSIIEHPTKIIRKTNSWSLLLSFNLLGVTS